MSENEMVRFYQALRNSFLLSTEQWEEAKLVAKNAQTPAKTVARELIKKGLLTNWQAQQLLKGRTTFYLENYRLVSKLGEGGMGTVFKAEELDSPDPRAPVLRFVAIKLMSKQAMENPDLALRFLREVEAATALKHPNIVMAFNAGWVGKAQYLVMEHVEGRDLKAWLKEYGRLPVAWSCECIRQAALGLQHAHETGVVHRDIKPGNLLVISRDAQSKPILKILDMGLARFTKETGDHTDLTSTGQVMGTFDYISPEQAMNTKQADIRSDIFSLGCTLFELLTGQVPFGGSSPTEKLFARAANDAPLTSTLRKDIPPALDAVVAKMMARDKSARYQTPNELVNALAPFVRGEELHLQLPQQQAEPEEIHSTEGEPQLQSFFEELRAGQVTHAVESRSTSLHLPVSPTGTSTQGFYQTMAPQPSEVRRGGRLPLGNKMVMGISAGAGSVLVLLFVLWLFSGGDQPPETPSATLPPIVHQEVGWQELLSLVNVETDSVFGRWQSTADGLRNLAPTPNMDYARFQLPFQPGDEFDVLAEFTVTAQPPAGFGQGEVAIIFPKGPLRARWSLWSFDYRHAGFIWDESSFHSNNATFTEMPSLEPGRRYRVRLEVRNQGVRGYLNGQVLSTWQTDFSNLSTNSNLHELHDVRCLGLAAYRTDMVFHSVSVRHVSGPSRLTRTTPP